MGFTDKWFFTGVFSALLFILLKASGILPGSSDVEGEQQWFSAVFILYLLLGIVIHLVRAHRSHR